ncbi:MAG: hypothetical protein QXV35_05760 [Archaeoglobaceae archaeon]
MELAKAVRKILIEDPATVKKSYGLRIINALSQNFLAKLEKYDFLFLCWGSVVERDGSDHTLILMENNCFFKICLKYAYAGFDSFLKLLSSAETSTMLFGEDKSCFESSRSLPEIC